MTAYSVGAQELRCPVCKKKFICWSKPEWCYKTDGGAILCSWTCYRKKEREPDQPQKRRYPEGTARRSQTPVDVRMEQARQIVELRRQGMRNRDIAKALGMPQGMVSARLYEFNDMLGYTEHRRKEQW